MELKNGETFNGTLVNCDSWMNMNLKDVICTSRDGSRFWKMEECYIKGNLVKYLRIPDEILTSVTEETSEYIHAHTHLLLLFVIFMLPSSLTRISFVPLSLCVCSLIILSCVRVSREGTTYNELSWAWW